MMVNLMTLNKNQQQWSKGDLEYLTECPVCSNKHQSKPFLMCKDRENIIPDIWTFDKCSSCDSLLLNPRPDTLSLSLAYVTYYTHEQENNSSHDNSLTSKLVNGYLNRKYGFSRTPSLNLGFHFFKYIRPFRQKLDYFARHLPSTDNHEKLKVLDVGCGSGEFLERAREMGYLAFGCEPDPVSYHVCLKKELSVLNTTIFDNSYKPGSFDAITLSHVLEHVTEPVKLIVRVMELLKPGGTFWLALPNSNSIGLRVYKQNWWGLHPPFHLFLPEKNHLIQWLNEAGFEDVRQILRGPQTKYFMNYARINNNNQTHLLSFISNYLRTIKLNIASIYSYTYSDELVYSAKKPTTSTLK